MIIEECFFQDNIYEKFNINTKHTSFQFECISLSNNIEKKKYEGQSNNYYKIIQKNNDYFLYYRASKNQFIIDNQINLNPNYHLEKLCIAKSQDGLNFEKIPILKNNVIMENDFCHNFFPNYIKNNYIGLSGTKNNNDGLYLFESEDGYNWNKKKKVLNENNILQYIKHKNHFDTHNSLNYNYADKFYYIHARHNHFDDTRKVQLIKTSDFKTLLEPSLIRINNSYNYEIYNLNITKLDEYKYFIGIPNYAESYYLKDADNNDFMVKKKFIKDLVISTDGINFQTIIPNINLSNMNDIGQICPVNGFVKSKDKKKIYFYFQNNVHQNNHEIQCYSIPYNRFISHYCYKYGYIRTKKLNLRNFIIEVNYKTSLIYKIGYLVVELLDVNDKRIDISTIMKGNELNKKVIWFYKTNKNKINNYYLKFHLYNCNLFSYNYKEKYNNELDFIWSKGIFNRTNYMLKSTMASPDKNIINNLINDDDNYIWIRNNLKKYEVRDLEYLSRNLKKLKKEKILVISDGDDSFPSSYNRNIIDKLLNCSKIKYIYAQNYDKSIIHYKIRHYPIGLDLHSSKFLSDFTFKQKIDYYITIRKSLINYECDKIFCDSYLSKTHSHRSIMYEKIKNNENIVFLEEKLDFKNIIKEYRKYKFVLSPRGNGLDCHRTWELFLLGCIVITETSPLDDMWRDNNLPVIILDDYNNLNNNNIKKRFVSWYKKMNKLTELKNILPKFKNSYWLNKN
jgi:hypothetical protein